MASHFYCGHGSVVSVLLPVMIRSWCGLLVGQAR